MNTLIVGHKIIRLDTVNSTNFYLSENLNNLNFFEGVIIVAENQTNGRGQGKNIWHSKSGENLLFSVLLKPKCDLSYQFYLNKLIATSLCQTLNLFGLDCSIKWPNDILVNDKKIAGILIENKIKGRTLDSSIIGIGLNINQSDFPNELLKPTSMSIELKSPIDKEDVLKNFIVKLEKKYFQFKRNEFEMITNDYHSLLYKKNNKMTFLINNKRVKAIIKSVNNNGELVLEINNKLTSFSNADVKMIRG
jgi:BirA family biotin operon repressor/biotin-[acetyl-CoA-carboxylase] ligase